MIARYDALVAAGELRADAGQRAAAERFDRLQAALEAGRPAGLLSGLFGRKSPSPRGIYMWGGVGRGKSMLMDLFVDTLAIAAKRRVHFHAFMLEVDGMIRDERAKESGDPIAPVAARIAADVRCLAFDEMVVNNTADAAIMARLFTALIVNEGVTVVTTSNRPPRDLYKDGLNRSLFLPFIALVEDRLDVVPLDGPVDYRLDRLAGISTWHSPLGEAATAQVREAFFRLTDYRPEDAANVPSAELDLGGGRTLHVPKSLKGVAVFSFSGCAARTAVRPITSPSRAPITPSSSSAFPRWGRQSQRGDPLHQADRRAVRTQRQTVRHRGCCARCPVYRRRRQFRIRPYGEPLEEMRSADYMAHGHGVEG